MQTISYETYVDKAFGCWLGKSIGGTLGGPYEGRKELFHYAYDPKAIEAILPNDDLDLQVLWLDVLERKGIFIDSMDLAEAFFTKVPYAPGEYAFFKKNYARGIWPPLSGSFNNRYYVNGMGCPIRSEIWGLICPGNPALAASYAAEDGVLDHAGDSVYAEQFYSAMEAAAFFESDLERLFAIGLESVPPGTRVRKMIDDVLKWSREEKDFARVRQWIIRDYGHPDCTNMYQNVGFTLLALVHGGMDFLKTNMIALNCGFDTDCTCATAASILGIIRGANWLIKEHNFFDTRYVLSVPLTRRSDKLKDLAEDTCKVGLTVAEHLNKAVKITGGPRERVPAVRPAAKVAFEVDYHGVPVVAYGQSKRVTITVKNPFEKALSGTLKVEVPEGWTVEGGRQALSVPAKGEAKAEVVIAVPVGVKLLMEKNILRARFSGDGVEAEHEFGLNGAVVWRVYGPFWENYADLPQEELGKSYYHSFKPAEGLEGADLVRQYHLNTKTANKAYVGEDVNPEKPKGDSVVVNTYEDLFAVEELVGFKGPCVVYAERRLYSPEERTVHVQVGHTDAYKLWLNGKLISEAKGTDWWTAENCHLADVKLRKGENHVLLKCLRRGKSAEYSLMFTVKGTCTDHVYDLGSYTG